MTDLNTNRTNEGSAQPSFLSCEFPVFRLIDPDSVPDRHIMAANDSRAYCLSISSSHVTLKEGSWESSIALNKIYEKTGQMLHFPMDEVHEIVATRYFWDKFSLTYRRGGGDPESLIVVLGETDVYHEIEYFFLDHAVAKGGRDIFLSVGSEETGTVLRLRDILSSLLDSVMPE